MANNNDNMPWYVSDEKMSQNKLFQSVHQTRYTVLHSTHRARLALDVYELKKENLSLMFRVNGLGIEFCGAVLREVSSKKKVLHSMHTAET